jgi:hypothetical protein
MVLHPFLQIHPVALLSPTFLPPFCLVVLCFFRSFLYVSKGCGYHSWFTHLIFPLSFLIQYYRVHIFPFLRALCAKRKVNIKFVSLLVLLIQIFSRFSLPVRAGFSTFYTLCLVRSDLLYHHCICYIRFQPHRFDPMVILLRSISWFQMMNIPSLLFHSC